MAPRAGASAKQAARAGAADAVRKVAEDILARSDAALPIGDPAEDPDPSFALVEKGSVSYSDDGRVATIRYPGPYAAKQHEARSYEHPRGGGPKFLEDALKAVIPHVADVVAGEVRARVKRRR